MLGLWNYDIENEIKYINNTKFTIGLANEH